MRSFKFLLIAALVLSMGTMSYAELTSVEVGGSLRIRGDMVDMEDSGDLSWVTQRTTLNVKAQFTDDVNAFIEVDTFDVWGADFRSFYPTGVDMAAPGGDVNMYQAYIEAKDMYDTALSLRVGRQELVFGSQWLLGRNDANAMFTGLSYDALRLTYGTDTFTLDAFWAKLAEGGIADEFGDNDVDLYGIYGSYLAVENWVFDGYWLFVREDGVGTGGFATDSDLHTIGARGAGVCGAFDFELEAAFQFGDVDSGPDWDGWAANFVGGYTFDVSYQPRLFLGAAFFEGGDGTDNGFNRLFSNYEYVAGVTTTELSNAWLVDIGIMLHPTESTMVMGQLTYLEADEVMSGTDDELGMQLILLGVYNYSDDLQFEIGYAHLFGDDGMHTSPVRGNGMAAGFLAPFPTTDAAGDEDDVDYLWIQTKIAF